MEQRCSIAGATSRNHGDRGIRLRFTSAEEFIRWAMVALPHETYEGVQFDRIDNEGHYAQDNLRLSTLRVNSMNRRDTVLVPYMGQQVVRHHLWDLVKTDRPDFPLGRDGLIRRLQRGQTVEQALSGPYRVLGSTTSSTPDPAIVSLYRG